MIISNKLVNGERIIAVLTCFMLTVLGTFPTLKQSFNVVRSKIFKYTTIIDVSDPLQYTIYFEVFYFLP